MGSTPNYSWPYPALTDPPNVPQHMQSLADAADTTVKGIDTRLATAEGRITALVQPPHATLAMSGDTVLNNTPKVLAWNLEYADTAGGHSELDNTRYTVQRAGRYLVSLTLAGTLAAGGLVQAVFVKSGTSKAWAASVNANPGQFVLHGVHLAWLNFNDYIQVEVYQTTGQSMQLYPNTNDNGACLLEINWLGET